MRDRRALTTATITVVGAIAAGAALGTGTQILQGVLPGGWGVLANSGVMWALAAFALGAALPAIRPAPAAVGGAIELVVASCTYYLAVGWFEHSASNARSAIIWSLAGVMAGSVFGAAGHIARRRPEWRGPSLALVGGTLVGEGVHLTWFVGNPALRWAGIVEMVIAAVIGVACSTRRHRAAALGVVGAAAVLTLLAGSVIDGAFAST
ncbi:MAG: hypothetical protein JWM34_2964 [Ilumatobacteraceae bacterium]|nr:hypothetical protein [Ilumatobacteraceae bacterium]